MHNPRDEALLDRVREIARRLGTHKEGAEKTGIPYATYQRILAGKSALTIDRVEQFALAGGVAVDAVLQEDGEPEPEQASNIISIPALNIKVAAGDGSLAVGERLAPGPIHFAGDWLRKSFGSIAGLRLAQIKGASQEPDLHDGDWVMIDESRDGFESGLAVLLLDDCLMIKWLQREGHMLKLLSRNPLYGPTILDLTKDEARIRVIGRVVWAGKLF